MIAQVAIRVSLPISIVVGPQERRQAMVPIDITPNQRDRTGCGQRPASGLQEKYAASGRKPLRIARVYRQYCDAGTHLYADRDGELARQTASANFTLVVTE